MRKRDAVVEGRFYPSTKEKIFRQISDLEAEGRYARPEIRPKKIFGAVLPHAGHIYSGHQTIPFFRLLQQMEFSPETFVIVHPNHSGHGAPLAIDDADMWSNSVGNVPIDRGFADSMDLAYDPLAHAGEHSAEVIIPFLQYFQADQPFSIVPVSMGDQSHGQALKVADMIGRAESLTGRRIMVLASCDFSHFLSPREGFHRDQHVIDEILAKNTAGVESAVKQHRASVCGYGPIMALMYYAFARDPEYRISILARGHSGEVIHSPEVVNYVSMMCYV